MPARQQSVIATTRSRPGRGFCSWLSIGKRELFYITSETSCRGSCQLPLQNCFQPHYGLGGGVGRGLGVGVDLGVGVGLWRWRSCSCSCSCRCRCSCCCRRRCRCSATRAGVGARACRWRASIAEVLSKGVFGSLHTRDIQLVAAGLDSAKDEVKLLVRIILIQPNLEIRSLSVIGEIHCAPFNVKDAIRCGARH